MFALWNKTMLTPQGVELGDNEGTLQNLTDGQGLPFGKNPKVGMLPGAPFLARSLREKACSEPVEGWQIRQTDRLLASTSSAISSLSRSRPCSLPSRQQSFVQWEC